VSDRLALTLPDELVEKIARRAAELVLAEMRESNGAGSPWLSLAQAADYIGVSTRQLQRLIAQGKVRSTTIGRRRLLRRDDLDEAAAREE
jgi:excisionase family DNA binding protein